MHVGMNACIHVCALACMHICLYACLHVTLCMLARPAYARVCIHRYSSIHVRTREVCIRYVCLLWMHSQHVWMHAHVWTYERIYVWMYQCMNARMYACWQIFCVCFEKARLVWSKNIVEQGTCNTACFVVANTEHKYQYDSTSIIHTDSYVVFMCVVIVCVLLFLLCCTY